MNKSIFTLALCAACSTVGAPDDAGGQPPTKPAANAAPAPAVDPNPNPSTKPTPTPLPEPVAVTDEEIKNAAQSIDAFSLDLYKRVAATPGNIVVSPASIAFALGMTYAGAKGETATQMAETLHVADSSLADGRWHPAMGGLMGSWNALKDREKREYLPELKLSLANRLYGDSTTKFHQPYLDGVAQDYRAPLQRLDFKGGFEAARTTINGWVMQQTYDRIADLIPNGGVNAATRMVLVNAVYFKAQWRTPFSKDSTTDRNFFTGATANKKVPMMQDLDMYSHAAIAADKLSIVELAYENGPFAMDVIVPDDKAGLAAVEAKLDMAHLSAWTSALSYKRVDVSLPRFKLAPESVAMAKTLMAMGMTKAFEPTADFTKMAPADEQIMISEVFHKAFIEVNEDGTEAAAATAVVARAGSAAPVDEPVAFVADRPFLYLIRDTQTGAILFMGRVADPGE